MEKNTYTASKGNQGAFFSHGFTYMARNAALAILILAAAMLTALTFSFTAREAIAANNITNVTVFSRTNVTNTEPNITSVVVDDSTKIPANEIDLTANNVTIVTCNATIFDYNGANDVINGNRTNATLFISPEGPNPPDDNNYRYSNTSCMSCRQANANEAPAGADPGNYAICDCRFAVQYYANYSSNWVCNFTATDSGGTQVQEDKVNMSDSLASGSVTVNKVIGIDANTILDYGNMSVTEVSREITHNLTNVGNVQFNLSLRGYGGTDEEIGRNATMICDFGNISIGYQRYALGTQNLGATTFDTMNNLTNQTRITNFTLPTKFEDLAVGRERNSTFWRLQVPLSVGGICNGTIIFGAVDNSNS